MAAVAETIAFAGGQMRLLSTVNDSVLSILSYLHLHLPPRLWVFLQPPICCGVWRSKLVPVCYRPPSATPNEAVMDQDGWPIKHWRKHVSSADSQPFDDVSCLLECLLRDLWPMPPPNSLSGVFVLCLLVLKTIWYSEKRCARKQSSSLKDTLLSKCPVSRQWYFQGLFVIKRSTSRIQSVLCSDWKSQSWLSKWQIRVEKPAEESPPPFDGVAKQNCRSTWRHRSPVAMPMLPYKRGRRRRSLSSVAHGPVRRHRKNRRKPAQADSHLKEVCYYDPSPLIGRENCELGRTRLSPCGAITCYNKGGRLNWGSGCTHSGGGGGGDEKAASLLNTVFN